MNILNKNDILLVAGGSSITHGDGGKIIISMAYDEGRIYFNGAHFMWNDIWIPRPGQDHLVKLNTGDLYNGYSIHKSMSMQGIASYTLTPA
jgi:uncharacterized protein (DUF2345 family)